MDTEKTDTMELSFSRFSRELHVHLDTISYNELSPEIRYDADGNEIAQRRRAIRVGAADVYRLLKPYLSNRMGEQVRAVVPLALYLAAFQIFVLQQSIVDAGVIATGLLAVIVGLMIFMEGLKVGLMPFGEMLGVSLPAKAGLATVLVVVFLLGIGVTGPVVTAPQSNARPRILLSSASVARYTDNPSAGTSVA